MHQKDKLRLWLIGIATLFLLGGSIFVVSFVNRSIAERKEKDLNKTLDLIVAGTNEKVATAVSLLYDLRGLVMLGGVTSQKWEDFVLINELEGRFPDVYSVAYVERVRKDNLKDFEEDLRVSDGEKYRKYTVFPKTNSAEYFPVKFIHTTDPELDVLLGFDFRYSEKSILTFTNSLQNNQPSMSELLHLDVIIPKSKQVGYEIVLPVYKDASAMSLPPEERRKLLMGFVGSWITPENLRNKNVDLTGLSYSVFDGNQKIYSVSNVDGIKSSLSKDFQVLNRKFKITLVSNSLHVLPGIEGNLPYIAFGSVLLVNLLWISTVISIMSARRQAINMATMATKDLRKFKQTVDGVSDHVVITNHEGVIVYANRAASQITGYSLEEMLGKKPSLWGGQMTKEYYQTFWNTIHEDKKPFTGELTNRRKNGELYESELRVSPILGEKGDLLFFVGIERDLSKVRAIEKMKTEFISLASHQLRTPLSAVKWFGEMLMDGDAGKLTKDQKKYVAKINESNEREIQLVNALLNVSRIESGKIVVLPKVTDMKKLVDDIISETKVGLVGQKRELVYKVGDNLPEVVVDADLIKHVYANLLTNAIKYSNEGGKIMVIVFVKGDQLISEIKDGGIGIPKAEQERIFEKFFRGSNALKKETDGNGLGLYLTKSIVESSGGKLWFESEVGKGSTFSFSLPLNPQKITKNPA